MAAQLSRVVALAAVMVLAPARSRAETRPSYGGAVVGSLLGEPATADPVAARSHADITLVGLVFDTLFRIGPDGEAVPHLAAAPPELIATRARITIRPGVVFHDGSPLDADDVAASLRRLARSDAGWLLAPVSAIEVNGDAIELTLRAATPELATLLAAPQASITPDGAAPAPRQPIGSGPFRVVALERTQRRIALAAFEGHFAGRPYLDELELRWFQDAGAEARLFETGAAQLSQRGATLFAGHQPKFAADQIESPATLLVFVGFGRRHADVTGHHDFRQALDLALPRSGFAAIGSGERVEPAVAPIPLELGGPGLDPTRRAGNLDAARAALARAGSAVAALAPARLPQLRLDVLIDETRLDDRAAAERVVRALDKLGVTATITAAGATVVATRIARGECDLYIGQIPAVAADPRLLWAAAFAAGDEAWARRQLGRGDVDPANAASDFARALPIVPLYHRAVRVHHRRDVRGIGFDAAARIGFADLFLFGGPAPERGPR